MKLAFYIKDLAKVVGDYDKVKADEGIRKEAPVYASTVVERYLYEVNKVLKCNGSIYYAKINYGSLLITIFKDGDVVLSIPFECIEDDNIDHYKITQLEEILCETNDGA